MSSINKVIVFILALIIGGLLAIISDQVLAADTNITTNMKGMPVPSAIAPSISTMNPKICKTGVSGGANTGVVSISGVKMKLHGKQWKWHLALAHLVEH